MLYHGSCTGNLNVLKPFISEHKREYVYLSESRVHALLYCVKSNFYTYGFHPESGKLVYTEYYKNALEDLYKGKRGYIYTCAQKENLTPLPGISFAFTSEYEVKILNEVVIDDVLDELLRYENSGDIIIRRYKDLKPGFVQNIKNQIADEFKKYKGDSSKAEYLEFLRERFPDV